MWLGSGRATQNPWPAGQISGRALARPSPSDTFESGTNFFFAFLDELGYFKHFEPYFIFWPPWPPLWPPLGAPFSQYTPFSQHGMLSFGPTKSLSSLKFHTTSWKVLLPLGAKGGVRGAMDPFFNRFSKYWLFLKSAGPCGSGGIIGFVKFSFRDEK